MSFKFSSVFLKVLKDKKEDILKKRGLALERQTLSDALTHDEANVSEHNHQVFKKLDDEVSFGQSAGLKDDLDEDRHFGK